MENPKELLAKTEALIAESEVVSKNAEETIAVSEKKVEKIIQENEQVQQQLDSELAKIAEEGDEDLAEHLKAIEEFDEPEA